MSDPLAPPAPAATTSAPAAAPTKGTLLLVDDVPENLRVLAEMLRQSGFSPRPVTSAAAAWKLLEKVPVDLILLDIHMPEENGYEFCTRLKGDRRYRDIPVLFLSAATDTGSKVESFQRGGVDYISKPFHFEEVQARVETHLGIRRLQREQQTLLARTLGGAVQTLVECLELASPEVFARASVVRDCVRHVIESARPPEAWALQVAGSLAFVGCLALPDEVIESAFGKEPPSTDARLAFERHADVGARLVSDVPRLERVAAMIRAQYDDTLAQGDAQVLQGARLLRAAQVFVLSRLAGNSAALALGHVRKSVPEAKEWFGHLESFPLRSAADAPTAGALKDMPVGAVVLEEVRTVDGRLLLGQGQEISKVLWLRLAEFIKAGRIRDHFVFQQRADLG